jgi:hypothetical protein
LEVGTWLATAINCALSITRIESGKRGESPNEKMGNPGIHPERYSFGGRMQKENRATAATATPSADGAYGLSVGKSEHGRKGSANNFDLADHECQRRQY